jgi:hypothetical protein
MTTLNVAAIRRYAGADSESAVRRDRSTAFLGLPTNRRHAGLALCWLVVAAAATLLLAGGDLAGIGYLVVAAVGYLFLHSRWLGSTLAGLAVLSGVYQLSQGNTAGVVVIAVGVLALALAIDPSWVAAVVGTRVAALAPRPSPAAAEPDTLATEEVYAPEPAFAGLSVQTIGRFRLQVGDRDLTAQLLDRPILAFIWMHLLARAIRNPEERMLRTALGDEVAPGLPSETQTDRLRGHIHDLRHELPPELRATIDADFKTIRLLIDGIRLDVTELRRLDQAASSRRLISVGTAAQIKHRLSELRWGEFLPGFEELEHKVTGGRGVAGALLNEVRADINTARGNLANALANHYLTIGPPAAAIPILEAALRLDSNREDLARRLVQVHVRCGHTASAESVTQQFGLSGEV